MAHRRRKLLIFLGAASAVWLVVWLLGLRAPRTPEETVRQALVAFVNHDPDTIFELISDEEKESTDVDLQSFRRFFYEYVEPKLKGFEMTGELKHMSVGEDGSGFSSNQALVHRDGRRIGIGFDAWPAGAEDSKLRSGVATLFLTCMISEFPPGPLPSGPGAVLGAWATVIERDSKKLQEIGIRKIWLMNNDPNAKPRTWDDWAQGLRRTVAKRKKEWQVYNETH